MLGDIHQTGIEQWRELDRQSRIKMNCGRARTIGMSFIDFENGYEPAPVRRLDQSCLILREPDR